MVSTVEVVLVLARVQDIVQGGRDNQGSPGSIQLLNEPGCLDEPFVRPVFNLPCVFSEGDDPAAGVREFER